MIEERVQIVESHGAYAHVVPTSLGSGCSACAASGGCGLSTLSRWVEQRQSATFRVRNPIGAQPGDIAIVGIRESTFLKGALQMYLLPLMSLLLFAAGATALFGPDHEVAVSLAGIVGLVSALGWLKLKSRRSRASDLPTLQRLARISHRVA